jgi:hypothetical protein
MSRNAFAKFEHRRAAVRKYLALKEMVQEISDNRGGATAQRVLATLGKTTFQTGWTIQTHILQYGAVKMNVNPTFFAKQLNNVTPLGKFVDYYGMGFLLLIDDSFVAMCVFRHPAPPE